MKCDSFDESLTVLSSELNSNQFLIDLVSPSEVVTNSNTQRLSNEQHNLL